MAKTNAKKQAKNTKAAKVAKTAMRATVRISSDKPTATVKFKVVRGTPRAPELVRATCRGEKPIFIKHSEANSWHAGVRGDTPVAARDPAKAFGRAVKAYWG